MSGQADTLFQVFTNKYNWQYWGTIVNLVFILFVSSVAIAQTPKNKSVSAPDHHIQPRMVDKIDTHQPIKPPTAPLETTSAGSSGSNTDHHTISSNSPASSSDENGMNSKDWVEMIQAGVSTLAILIGGCWLIHKRQIYPCLEIEQIISHWSLPNHQVLLRVDLKIKNIGNVLLRLKQEAGFIHVSKLSHQNTDPSQSDRKVYIRSGEGAWEEIIRWTLSGVDQNGDAIEIEPGENDEFHFDFIIPADILMVAVYTYIGNGTKNRHWQMKGKPIIDWRFIPKEIGWSKTTVYNSAVSEVSNLNDDTREGVSNEQKTRKPQTVGQG